jgi:hypothetical protein
VHISKLLLLVQLGRNRSMSKGGVISAQLY